jgi:hypothetical protein
MGNSVDRVHSAVNRRRSSGPWWTEGSADKRHGGASPALAEEDKEGKAKPEAGSPEYEWQRRGGGRLTLCL